VYSESTSLDMLSAMTDTLRLVAVGRSSRPRMRRGAMREIVGAVTSETNVVAESKLMVLGTSSMGLRSDLIKAGMNLSIWRMSVWLDVRCIAHILVLDQSASLLERDLGGLLDIRLGVPDGASKNRDEIRHSSAHLIGCGDDELLEHVEAASLDLPLASGFDLLEKCGKDDHGRPGVHRLDDRFNGGNSCILDCSNLVGKGFEKGGEWGVDSGRDDVGLENGSCAVFAEGRDGIASGLTGQGRLFVGQCLDASLARNQKIVTFPKQQVVRMRLMTHLDNGIGELDRSEELDALLLGGGSEAEGSIVTYSLVGKEEGGNVERAGLGDGFSNSGGRAHHEYYDMSGDVTENSKAWLTSRNRWRQGRECLCSFFDVIENFSRLIWKLLSFAHFYTNQRESVCCKIGR